MRTLPSIIEELPQPNKETLRFLFHFLKKVSESETVNKMTALNLAVVFGPTVMKAKTETLETAGNNDLVNSITELIILHPHLTTGGEKPTEATQASPRGSQEPLGNPTRKQSLPGAVSDELSSKLNRRSLEAQGSPPTTRGPLPATRGPPPSRGPPIMRGPPPALKTPSKAPGKLPLPPGRGPPGRMLPQRGGPKMSLTPPIRRHTSESPPMPPKSQSAPSVTAIVANAPLPLPLVSQTPKEDSSDSHRLDLLEQKLKHLEDAQNRNAELLQRIQRHLQSVE